VDVTAQRVPERAGPFRLLDRIGEGGMGVVYLAADADGRLVAVKLLRPWVIGGHDGRTRLAREVDATRRVRGPGVAEVVSADVTADVPYIATRYVPGPSLDAVIRSHGPLLPPALLRLATELADALAVVHAAGVVHRDVKPGNVLVAGAHPVLIDFGLARSAEDAPLTATGLVMGTPGYLAAESILGQPSTPATDVHGWAATVAFAATGRPPYGTGPDAVVLDRIRRGEADLTGLYPPLAPLVSRALATDPATRPALAEIRSVLGRLAGEQPHGSAPPAPVAAGPPAPVLARPVSLAASQASRQPPSVSPAASRPQPPSAAATPTPPAFRPAGPQPTGAATTTNRPGPPTRVEPQPAGAPDAWRLPFGVRAPDPVAGRAWDDAATRPASFAEVALGAALLVLVAVGTLVAPMVTLLAVAAAAWLARSGWLVHARAAQRRLLFGRRRYDAARTAVGLPWVAVSAAVGTVAHLALIVVAAVATAVLVDALAAPPRPTTMLAAGVAAALAAWWGPGSSRVRRGAQLALVRHPAPAWRWALAATLVVLAWGLAMWWESFGTQWWPSSAPPPGL
jgi:serine/threonine protein kinase